MLILMRRVGESIYIGPNIVVTLISLERNRARIGIAAPKEVVVDREEVKLRKDQEASSSDAAAAEPNGNKLDAERDRNRRAARRKRR